MGDQEARYDRIAEGYAAWWSPVHRGATLRLLDEVAPAVAAGARRILDVGCGTGAMAAESVGRWADVTVTGVDLSAGMLDIARREAATLPATARERLAFVHAPADRLPFADGAFDVVTAAFVLQLVPSRPRAMRELRRVLRPGGTLGHVSWLGDGAPFPGDLAWAAALAACNLDPREPDGPDDDVPTPMAAARQLRRAGFAGVTARGDHLAHAFTPEAYASFMLLFDEADFVLELDAATREALEADVLVRLRAMDPASLVLRLPIVYAVGRRSR